jgi:dienelactone hydrolase
VLEDRPFDDTGADTRPGNGPSTQTAVEAATLSGLCGPSSTYSTGDLSYPSGDAYGPRNAADLVQVRVTVVGDQVHVLWQLQTLVDPSVATVALLVDTDADLTTGETEGFRGFDRSVVVTGDGGRVGDVAVRSVVDASVNTVEAVLPRSLLPGSRWRVNAVGAVRDGDGLGALADAVHVADEPVLQAPACKLDAVQARRLAARDLTGAAVDVKRLERRDSDRRPLRRGGFTRYYVPEDRLGEGIVGQPRYGQTSSASIYRGTVQPYSVYVPQSYDPTRPAPVILLLHCLTCWHTGYDQAAFPGVARLAESRGALIVTPFGMGEGGHYEGEAEVDAFAVLSDVSRRYGIDQERIYLSGMSMGALGTYRLGLLHPDLWARLLPVASYTTPYCVTPAPQTVDCGVRFNYLDIFPNARNVPVGLVQGTLDELTPVTANRHFADVLTGLGYPFRYWEFPTRAHDPKLHGLTTDVTDPFLGDARRQRSPATVTYVLDRAMHAESRGMPDRAYWLSGLRLASDATAGRVDATSGRGEAYDVRPVSGSGSDEAGPWTMRGLDAVPATGSGRNELSLVVRGFTDVTADLARARLTRQEPLTIVADTDREVRLMLGQTQVVLSAGRSTHALAAQGSGAPGTPGGATPAAARLPATGSDALGLAPLALLLGLALVAAVRRA